MGAIRWLRRGMLLAGLGAAGGALVVTARHFLETPQPLTSELPGEGRIDRKHGGDIYYNVAGDEAAEPVVLLHDFYPGASNFEYRHIFPRLAATWRVYAPDWLGFGMSEHPPVAYTGEFYANTLIGFLRDVVARPAIVVGRGRAANIAARAASDAPDLFVRLALVSPELQAGITLDPKPVQLLARAAQRVSLGVVPYAFMSTKPLLRQMAHRRSAQTGEQSMGEDTVNHLYASAHQFGGQHALMALMAGELDLPLQNIIPLLQPHVLLISGDEDPAHPADAMEDLAVLNPYADLDVLAGAGEAVFEDQPAMFTDALLDWLATVPARQYPQVEESHPDLEATPPPAAAEVAEQVVPEQDMTDLPGRHETSEPDNPPVAENAPAAALPSDAPDTSGTSGTTPGQTREPAPRPPGKSGSTPARRATSRPVSASADQAGEASVPGGEQTRRVTRQARQQPGTSTSKKPGNRGSGAKKTADSPADGKSGTRKRGKGADSPSV